MLTEDRIQNLFDIDFENKYKEKTDELIKKSVFGKSVLKNIHNILDSANNNQKSTEWSSIKNRQEWILRMLISDCDIKKEIELVSTKLNRKTKSDEQISKEICGEVEMLKNTVKYPTEILDVILLPPLDLEKYVSEIISPIVAKGRETELFKNNNLYELFRCDEFEKKFSKLKILDDTRGNLKGKGKLKGKGEEYYKLLPVEVADQIRKKSGIVGCPYCNRNYVGFDDEEKNTKKSTKKNTKKKEYIAVNRHNSQLDHIYPKEFFPELALSLYNLIPSCSSCNNSKRSHFLSYHPYISRQPSDGGRFSFGLTKDNLIKAHNVEDLEDITIIVNERYAQFKLNPQYAIHQNYLKSVAMTYKQYIRNRNEKERKKIKAILIGKGVSKNLASTDDVTLSHLTKEFLNHLEEIDKKESGK